MDGVEPTSEDMEPEATQGQIPRVDAAMMPVGGPRKRHKDAKSGCRTLPEIEGDDTGKAWIPEEIGRRRQKDDPPCENGTAEGKGLHNETDSRTCGSQKKKKT